MSLEFRPGDLSPDLAAQARAFVANDLKLDPEEQKKLLEMAKANDGWISDKELRFIEGATNLHNAQQLAYTTFDSAALTVHGKPLAFRETVNDNVRKMAELLQGEVTAELISSWQASGNVTAMFEARMDPDTPQEMKARLTQALAETPSGSDPKVIKQRRMLFDKLDQAQPAGERHRLAKLAAELFPKGHPAIAAYQANPAQDYADGFSDFVATRFGPISDDYEMDCADFATYMWQSYVAEVGEREGAGYKLPGTFVCYTKNDPEAGIIGVDPKRPTMFNGTMHAALFQSQYAEPIPQGRTGTTKTGITFPMGGRQVDFGEIRPGDLMFLGDAEGAHHAMLVVGHDRETGTLTIAQGNYSSHGGTNPYPIRTFELNYRDFRDAAYFERSRFMGVYQVKSF